MRNEQVIQENSGLRRIPPLWPYLVICLVTGLTVSLGNFHKWHNGDSLIPVLVSLQKWTPFFWDQDRIGMLVPLLTLPLRDPLWNLLVQEAIYVSAGLAAMFLLPRYVLPGGNYGLAGTLSAVSCLALGPGWLFGFTAFTFYGVWLALGLGGLILVEPRPGISTSWRSWLAALALMILAHWVYSATALMLGPLVVARYWIVPERTGAHTLRGGNGPWSAWTSAPLMPVRQILKTRFAGELLLLTVGFVIGLFFFCLAREFSPCHTNTSSLPASQWPKTWWQIWNNGWVTFSPYYWPSFLIGIILMGAIELGVPERRHQARMAWRAALAIAIAATVYFLFMGTRQWMVLSSYNGRYAFPWLFLLQGAVAIFAVGRISTDFGDWPGWLRYVLSATSLLLAAVFSFQWPSVNKVHQELDRTIGARTNDILAAHCTHVAGDYWKVWPSVFHANLVLHDQGDKRTIWGITFRTEPTRPQWQHLPVDKFRIAVPLEDMEVAGHWLQALQLPPMTVVEKRSTIYVLRPTSVVQRGQQQGCSVREQH
jgi:hypothetical protein